MASPFKWKIAADTLSDMKSTEVGKEWMSPTFRLGGFTWYMKLYPNGNRESHKGFVAIYLYLAVLPPKLKSVSTRYTGSKPFNNDHDNWGWGQITLSTEKFKQCPQFTV